MKPYDTRIFITSDISDGFIIAGRYDKKIGKTTWFDYSEKINIRQEDKIISKILSYSTLSSPLIIVPLILLFSDKMSFLTIEEMLRGKLNFWILTIIFGFLVTNSIQYRLGKHKVDGEKIPELGLIIEKNVITCQIDRGLRRYRIDETSFSSLGGKIPYIFWILISSVVVGATVASYYASNDSNIGFGGQFLFYIILVILIATLITLIQVVIPVYHKLVILEKKMDLSITQLNSEQLQVELNKAEDFYERHKVSHAAIKRYLAEYNKLLEEKEKGIQK